MKMKRWHWVEPRGQWQRVPPEADRPQVGNDIAERIRNRMPGVIGFALNAPVPAEDAQVLKDAGFILGAKMDGNELWITNPFKEREMAYKQPELSGEIRSWLREGAKDLHNAIVPAFPSSQHGVDEQGTPLSPTSWGASQSLYGDARSDATGRSDEAAGQGDSYQAMLDSYSRSAPQQEREDEDADER